MVSLVKRARIQRRFLLSFFLPVLNIQYRFVYPEKKMRFLNKTVLFDK